MRVARPLLALIALVITVAGCAREPVMRVQMAAGPTPYGIDNVVYGSAPAAYGAVAASPYQTMAAAPAHAAAAPAYASVAAPTYAAPSYAAVAAPTYGTVAASPYGGVATTGSVVMAGGYPGMLAASPAAYAPPLQQFPYTLDSGDRLRVVVFGQDGLTNSYVVDVSGDLAMPLIGSVAARGLTTDQLSARIADLLRQGYVRDPHVAVEVEAYRPFFILGEVTQPGQYPYVANMTVETAVAIAGGFGPRGYKKYVVISRNYGGEIYRFKTPITAQVQPGDTIQVQERWF
jgi:protein involved in polysaccharide export with SLBB domain